MNVYIHIPFCTKRCSYCHFNSTTNLELIDNYIDALIKEIQIRLPYPINIETVYFGGGTPSLLSNKQIIKVLLSILNKSKIAPSEITIEANPNTISLKSIEQFKQIGINRLSIGIQSWNKDILLNMNREANYQNIKKIIKHALRIGLSNINIDHIIGYPGQNKQIIISDIKKTLLLKPSHISIYPLEIHPNTKIHEIKIKYSSQFPSNKKIVDLFSIIQIMLIEAGYIHYEEFSFLST